MKRLLFVGLLSASVAHGEEPKPDPCATQTNTVEINYCAKLMLDEKDKELNAAYQKLLTILVPYSKDDPVDYTGVRRQLVEAQRNWVAFRDNDCKAKYTLNEQGTIRNVVYLGCLIEHTEQRTKQLLSWAEG
jgi:uncharacterized protein YecT (DUF1311 family)